VTLATRWPPRTVYAVTPETERTGERLLDSVRAALRGGAYVLQYRDKRRPYEERRELAQAMRKLCVAYARIFIVNDDIALAQEVGADGVHLGKEDLSELAQLRLRAPNLLVGVSCYNSLARAEDAVTHGADYVAFGSVFPSLTKPQAVPCDLQVIRDAYRRLPVPIVAIGGITSQNARQVIDAGAHAVAVISGIFGHDDVESSTRLLCQRLANNGN